MYILFIYSFYADDVDGYVYTQKRIRWVVKLYKEIMSRRLGYYLIHLNAPINVGLKRLI